MKGEVGRLSALYDQITEIYSKTNQLKNNRRTAS